MRLSALKILTPSNPPCVIKENFAYFIALDAELFSRSATEKARVFVAASDVILPCLI